MQILNLNPKNPIKYHYTKYRPQNLPNPTSYITCLPQCKVRVIPQAANLRTSLPKSDCQPNPPKNLPVYMPTTSCSLTPIPTNNAIKSQSTSTAPAPSSPHTSPQTYNLAPKSLNTSFLRYHNIQHSTPRYQIILKLHTNDPPKVHHTHTWNSEPHNLAHKSKHKLHTRIYTLETLESIQRVSNPIPKNPEP